MKLNDTFVRSVSVSSDSDGLFDIQLIPFNRGYNFPMFEVMPGQVVEGESLTVERLQLASPPLTGNFSIRFKNQIKKGNTHSCNILTI